MNYVKNIVSRYDNINFIMQVFTSLGMFILLQEDTILIY